MTLTISTDVSADVMPETSDSSALAATGAAWHHCQWSLYARDHIALVAREAAGPAALEARARGASRRVPAPPT